MALKECIKVWLKKNIVFARRINFLYTRLFCKNAIHIQKSTSLDIGLAKVKKTQIVTTGKNNRIVISDYASLDGCKLLIYGDGNEICIGQTVYMKDVELYIEDSGNRISIGKNSTLCGSTQFAAIEGTQITLGENCLLSSQISFRTGDSHSILNAEGKRINPSEDIVIGDHVWIGNQVTILKGTVVPENCVVGATSTVTKSFAQANCILAGVPAKVIKENVNWCAERIPMEAVFSEKECADGN